MSTAEMSAPRRRPGAGGYARGEETRARIISAALQVFGEEGYARASTRQIAARAEVNPPALQYYFDSKEGLHLACAQLIIDRVQEMLAPSMAAAEAALAAPTPQPEQALEALCRMLDDMVSFGLTSTDARGWSRFMAAGQTDPTAPAFPLLRESIGRPIHLTAARLVAAVTGRPADSDETRLRAWALLGQAHAFQVGREKTLAVMGWSEFGDDQLAQIKAVLRAHARGALSAVLGQPAGAAG